ncbi:type II toxin-antitoxin system VapC family toxin [Bifidobacterium avesanii]|uniref:PIN domain-containing protein n=1 Tax=Bifidobacterium avesanii TaxID=1798157 RepID=A0A7K3TGM6_9BIFI|nr:PIN domain-containing protein [Bifidobacterium avesanii]KAB8295417.1 twitching motility protein PilT [Bifidobacterium avesanii]NEG77423.1 PIN domain-containing protein [Bifidobacterium avesanii]
MLKLFLDTNVLLDAVGLQREGHAEARRLLLIDPRRANLGISAGSLKDFYFTADKAKAGIGRHGGLDDAERRRWIGIFMDLASILPDDERTAKAALESNEPDYEDGTKRATAEAWEADWIVTRDSSRHAFERSPIPTATAAQIIKRL